MKTCVNLTLQVECELSPLGQLQYQIGNHINMEREGERGKKREREREIYIYIQYIHTWGISTYVDHVVIIMDNTIIFGDN